MPQTGKTKKDITFVESEMGNNGNVPQIGKTNRDMLCLLTVEWVGNDEILRLSMFQLRV